MLFRCSQDLTFFRARLPFSRLVRFYSAGATFNRSASCIILFYFHLFSSRSRSYPWFLFSFGGAFGRTFALTTASFFPVQFFSRSEGLIMFFRCRRRKFSFSPLTSRCRIVFEARFSSRVHSRAAFNTPFFSLELSVTFFFPSLAWEREISRKTRQGLYFYLSFIRRPILETKGWRWKSFWRPSKLKYFSALFFFRSTCTQPQSTVLALFSWAAREAKIGDS